MKRANVTTHDLWKPDTAIPPSTVSGDASGLANTVKPILSAAKQLYAGNAEDAFDPNASYSGQTQIGGPSGPSIILPWGKKTSGTIDAAMAAAPIFGEAYGGLRGFTSRIGKWVEGLSQDKFTADQLWGMMKTAPIKADEMKWLGLGQWLDKKAADGEKISKSDVLDFIDQHQIQMQEVRLKGRQALGVDTDEPLSTHYNETEYKTPGGKNYREVLIKFPGTQPKYEVVPHPYREGEWLRKDTKFGSYVGPYGRELGSKNLLDEREMGFESPEEAASNATQPQYQSGHFVDNIGPGDQSHDLLAHARVQDFKDTEGKKVLLVDELQSDWHREGRKYGYNTDGSKNTLADYSNADAAREDNAAVPDAPFKSTWHELVMKTMLRDAVEKGYDKIAWTTGKMQQDRWSLTRFFPKLTWEESTAEHLNGVHRWVQEDAAAGTKFVSIWPDSARTSPEVVNINKLEDYVGQAAADHIRQQLDAGVKSGDMTNVKSGGEWAENLYDKAVPSFMEKYGKQWGAKVEKTSIRAPHYGVSGEDVMTGMGIPAHEQQAYWATLTAEKRAALIKQYRVSSSTREVWSMPITPEMRKSITSGGQHLWNIPAAAVGTKFLSDIMSAHQHKENN